MIGAGAVNFIGPRSIRDSFARWGYPLGFHRVTGGLEMTAGLLLPDERPLIIASAGWPVTPPGLAECTCSQYDLGSGESTTVRAPRCRSVVLERSKTPRKIVSRRDIRTQWVGVGQEGIADALAVLERKILSWARPVGRDGRGSRRPQTLYSLAAGLDQHPKGRRADRVG